MSNHTETNKSESLARYQTLRQLVENLLKYHLDPVPAVPTLRAWFDRERIPRIKANPTAKRGGGHVFYSAAQVEKLLRTRALPGRIQGGGK